MEVGLFEEGASSLIDIVGAGYSAEDEDSDLEMTFDKAEDEEVEKWEEEIGDKFINDDTVAVEINLIDKNKAAGEQKVENISAPITITMPIPKGLTGVNLWILHLTVDAQNNKTVEYIKPAVNITLMTCTFTVDGFSTYLFTEPEAYGYTVVYWKNAIGAGTPLDALTFNGQYDGQYLKPEDTKLTPSVVASDAMDKYGDAKWLDHAKSKAGTGYGVALVSYPTITAAESENVVNVLYMSVNN